MKRLLLPLLALLLLGCGGTTKFEHPDAVRCDTVRIANSIDLIEFDSLTSKYVVVGHMDTMYVVEFDALGRLVNQTIIDHWPPNASDSLGVKP